MAELSGALWKYNLAKVVVLDVTDDYILMQPPLPSNCYPIIAELWMPRFGLASALAAAPIVEGYAYDWHERPLSESGEWYVGVVDRKLAMAFVGGGTGGDGSDC